jgi:hypothetical protein
MADYHPLIVRAISRLDSNTAAGRRSVYARARAALVALLNGQNPPVAKEEIEREHLALEDAIRKVEFETIVGKAPAKPCTSAPEKERGVFNQHPGEAEPRALSGGSGVFTWADDETFDFRYSDRAGRTA